jgi:O-antigen/teichoic acid export membrane protein
MTLGQRIRTGVAWLMFGSTGSQVLNFLFGIALARLLVPADFGMVATIHILTGVVSLISSGGMAQSLIRAKEADEADFNVVFTFQLGIGVLLFGTVLLIAPWFARFFENPLYVQLLVISAMNFLLRPFALIRSAWLNRGMNFKGVATINLATTVVSQAASVAMAMAGMGVWSLMFGGLIAALSTNALLYRLVPLRLRLRFDREVARRHAAFGFNITVLDLFGHFRVQAISLILSKLAGPSVLGLFNKAENLSRMPNRLITPATGRVVFRALSSVADDLGQSRYIFFRTVTLLSAYVFPVLVGMVWIAEPLIGFLYGAKWLPSADPLRIMAISGFFLTTSRPCSVLLEAQNRLRQSIVITAACTAIGIVACLVGLNWGLTGVAWGVVFTHVVNFLLLYLAVAKVIPASFGHLARALVPALILNGLLNAALVLAHFSVVHLRETAPHFYLAAMVAAGGTVYALAFLFLPIKALESEATRWRTLILGVLRGAGRLRR